MKFSFPERSTCGHDGIRFFIDLFAVLFGLDNRSEVIDISDVKEIATVATVECQLITVFRGSEPRTRDKSLSFSLKSTFDRMTYFDHEWVFWRVEKLSSTSRSVN